MAKFRYTKERQRDSNEFVYLHREKIRELLSNDYISGKQPIREFIKLVVRVDLGYSPSTADCDIWASINITFNELFKNN